MDTDTKINFVEDIWKKLPGMERVPTLPTQISMDIHTKLLLENEASWVSIARLFQECKMEKNICYAYERALANNPMSFEALSEIAPIYLKKKNYAKALEVYLRLYRISEGKNILYAANIAFCYLMLDNFSESFLWYRITAQNAVQIKKEKGFLWYGIGVFYERLNNLQIAEEAYAYAIKIDLPFSYSLETYFRLGVTYLKRGAIQTAMDCFEYLLNNIPKNYTSPSKQDIYVQLAHLRELQHRDDEALEILRDICMDNKKHEKAAMLLAWLYYKDGNWNSAEEVLKSCTVEEGLCAFSWYIIGRCKQKIDCFKEAYRCYHMALTKDPGNHFYWNSIGILYFSLSQFEDALGAFKKSIELDPGFVMAIYNLGVVYEQFQDTLDSALQVYRQGCEAFPNDRLIYERIEELEAKKAEKSEEAEFTPQKVPLRDIRPNPVKTPYFLAHSLLGNKPTSFVFHRKEEKKEIDRMAEELHNQKKE